MSSKDSKPPRNLVHPVTSRCPVPTEKPDMIILDDLDELESELKSMTSSSASVGSAALDALMERIEEAKISSKSHRGEERFAKAILTMWMVITNHNDSSSPLLLPY
jgi:HPt (histidine-containing phosphotransfer) domain-containing protein